MHARPERSQDELIIQQAARLWGETREPGRNPMMA